MFFDFAMIAMDQIVNQAAKYRYFSGHSLPLMIRTMCGAGGPNGAQHSQNFEAWYSAVPGLKVVMPSNAADAKGLLKSSIRDDDPVLFIETLGLLPARTDVPPVEDWLVPIGVADVRREGTDVTVVAIGRLRSTGRSRRPSGPRRTASRSRSSIPRTLQPLDTDDDRRLGRQTGRLVVAQEATSPYSFAAEVCALAAEHCLSELRTAPVRVTSPFVNVPTPVPLAEARAPGADDVLEAVLEERRSRMSQLIEIKVDDPGNTVEVEVVEVFVEEGATVEEGEPLLEIATDKANMELTAPEAGVIEKLLCAQGDIVPATQVFAHLRT